MSNTEYPTLASRRPRRPRPMRSGDELLREAMKSLPQSATIAQLLAKVDQMRQADYFRFDQQSIALNDWVDNAVIEVSEVLKLVPSDDLAALIAAHGSPRLLASLVACAGIVSAK